jgi:hypothetical protein
MYTTYLFYQPWKYASLHTVVPSDSSPLLRFKLSKTLSNGVFKRGLSQSTNLIYDSFQFDLFSLVEAQNNVPDSTGASFYAGIFLDQSMRPRLVSTEHKW